MVRVGGTVRESSAGLRLFGDDLDPDEVTRVLGCPPTRAYRKGDAVEGSRYDVLRRTGSWQLDSDAPPSLPLDEKVAALVARVSSDPAVWRGLSHRFKVDVFCGVYLDEWNRGCGFGPDLLRRLAEMGAEFGLDIYGPDSPFPGGPNRSGPPPPG